MAAGDPLRAFGHSHARLNELMLALAELLGNGPLSTSSAVHDALPALSAELRDELLAHFANEEEGLFPFIREHVPARGDAVDRLQAAHDVVCGALVRFSYLAEREGELSSDVHLAYERFQAIYGAHSRDEAELLDELARLLTPEQQAELESLLRGLG